MARISFGASGQQVEVAGFEFAFAPQESRVFPLNSRGATGDSCTPAIYKQTGALILPKNAAIKRGSITAQIIMTPPAPFAPIPTKTVATGAKELTVKARQAAGRPSKSWRVEIIVPVAQQPSQPQGIEVKAPAAEQRTNRRTARRPSSRASRK